MSESNKKVFQILTHLMPWEIDNCLILFDTLSRARKFTKQIYNIDVALNLSSYHVNWEQSKLDKDFFKEKLHYYAKLLEGFNEVNITIYEGEDNYGHLDLQKAVIKPENDYYICITPDQLFHPSILYYFENSVGLIPEKYFLITAEIPKFWDRSWDIISNENFNHIPYQDAGYDFLSINRYDALHVAETDSIDLIKLNTFKFAGWLDLFNKNFYETLVPVPEDWVGYGQWDLYSLLILDYLKHTNFPIDVAQYKLKNAVTISIEYANWNYGDNRSIYKSRLSLNEIPDARAYYSQHMHEYINKQLNKIADYEYTT